MGGDNYPTEYGPAPAELAAIRNKISAKCEQGAAGRTWSEISLPVRTALVMLAIDAPCDARVFARQQWGTYTSEQQVTLGAIARQFKRELSEADALR